MATVILELKAEEKKQRTYIASPILMAIILSMETISKHVKSLTTPKHMGCGTLKTLDCNATFGEIVLSPLIY